VALAAAVSLLRAPLGLPRFVFCRLVTWFDLYDFFSIADRRMAHLRSGNGSTSQADMSSHWIGMTGVAAVLGVRNPACSSLQRRCWISSTSSPQSCATSLITTDAVVAFFDYPEEVLAIIDRQHLPDLRASLFDFHTILFEAVEPRRNRQQCLRHWLRWLRAMGRRWLRVVAEGSAQPCSNGPCGVLAAGNLVVADEFSPVLGKEGAAAVCLDR
jgi:hypothetical protein